MLPTTRPTPTTKLSKFKLLVVPATKPTSFKPVTFKTVVLKLLSATKTNGATGVSTPV